MMIEKEVNNLKEQYITSAMEHGIASLDGNYKVANKEYKKIEKIFNRICKNSEESKEFFSSLLQHNNSNVRVWASSHALKQNILINESIKVLREVESEGVGVANLAAKITLKQWGSEHKLGGR